ncbi:MAG: type III pantothenate kinase [Candidatus Methylacidiphilales bacterium]|nr:type III pantothenate kinase [Candidatus Methylacidiphilales bacterium]
MPPAPGPALLVNINNTWTKFCPLVGGRLGRIERCLTRDLQPAFLRRIQRRHPGHPLVVCSVVPQARKLLDQVWPAKQLLDLDHRNLPGIKIKYPRPKQIGADRLANTVAVCHLHPLPAIVVDLGTALTFDIISSRAEYLGGVIAPGLQAFTDYLHERTALLPRVKLTRPSRAVGKSTREAICIGAFHGYRGLVQEVLSQVRAELGSKNATVITTGGDCLMMKGALKGVDVVDPLLGLRGLKIVAHHLLG